MDSKGSCYTAHNDTPNEVAPGAVQLHHLGLVSSLASPTGGWKQTSLGCWQDQWLCDTWVHGVDKPLKPMNYQGSQEWFCSQGTAPFMSLKRWSYFYDAPSVPVSVKPSLRRNLRTDEKCS